MFIKKLELENWKCFEHKKVFNFSKHMLLSYRNGYGKSSIMEAIQYSFFGKLPVGFNLNTVRNSYEKPCRVCIYFEIEDNGVKKEASIERVFGDTIAANNICELTIDEKLICESVRTVASYMDNLFNQKITSQLWTNSLTTSDVLSSDFFTKGILEDILKEPIKLSSFYKSKIYSSNRTINSFKEKIYDIDTIKKELEDIKSKIKEKPKNDNINSALASKKAKETLDNLQKELDEYINNNNTLPTLDEARKFTRTITLLSKYERQLKEEEEKEDNIYSKFTKREIEKILSVSEELGNCIICGSIFTKEHKENTLKQLENCGRSESKIKELKENIDFLNRWPKSIVEKIIEIDKQRSVYEKCINYEDVINSYNKENNDLWVEMESLQKELTLAIKQQDKINEINELKEKVEDYRNKLNFINKYIQNASEYHTNKLLSKASKYLLSTNSRYKQICLYENNFNVVVEENETLALRLLPVARLSSGEKTMCALSLLFAIHNMITPGLPLIFDETFANLDKENLEQIKKFLRSQDQNQIFVITHDTTWTEF